MNQLIEKMNRQATPLVVFGLTIIATILVFTAASRLSSNTQAVKTQLATSSSELLTLTQLQDDDIWSRRLEVSNAARGKIDEQVWTGDTVGIIAADIEQTLRKLANKSGSTQLRLKVDPETENIADLDVIFFDLRGQVETSHAAIDLLDNLANGRRRILVAGASLSLPEKRAARVTIKGYVPVKVSVKTIQ